MRDIFGDKYPEFEMKNLAKTQTINILVGIHFLGLKV